MNKFLKLVLASAVLSLLSCSQTPSITAQQVQSHADRLARWQLEHMGDFEYVRTFRDHTAQPDGWVQAAFYIGLNRWNDTGGEGRYLSALQQKAEANRWQLGPLYWHADDQAIAQLYLALIDSADSQALAPTQTKFDDILAYGADNSLEFIRDDTGQSEGTCQRRWCWSDALFMAPPAWAAMSRISGDEQYLNYALTEFWATTNYLFDPTYHLYYRDSRFFDRASEHDNKVFWSRGNGWVFAGLPLLLEQLPDNHPERPKLIAHYRKMAYAFGALQTAEGLWAPSLLDNDYDPLPETSGSSFVVFGLAWGVNRGLLPAADFNDVIVSGWQAIDKRLTPEGWLGWVQQVGYAPDKVHADDTQLYGSGAYLLAASEMLDYDAGKASAK
jgi:rhamnogalacturonyl hydrolase YesR